MKKNKKKSLKKVSKISKPLVKKKNSPKKSDVKKIKKQKTMKTALVKPLTQSSKKKSSKSSKVKPKTAKKSSSTATHSTVISKQSVKTIVTKKKIFKNSPVDNLNRPFNIIESYMGAYSFNDMFSVLFVCTGNICRSPMAEGLLRKKIYDEFPKNLKEKTWVHSAGIYAYEGNKPSENAIKICGQNNIDINAIRSKPISRVLIEQSDLVFALSIDHLNFIIESFPSAKSKTFLLKAFEQNRSVTISDSIPDPMGFSMEFYLKTFAEIKNALDQVFPKILERAKQKLEAVQPTL